MSDTQDPRTEAQAAIQYWSNRLNEIEGQQAQAPTDIPPEQPYAVPTTPQYLPPREMAERIHREAIANGATEADAQARVLAGFSVVAQSGDKRYLAEGAPIQVFGIPLAE